MGVEPEAPVEAGESQPPPVLLLVHGTKLKNPFRKSHAEALSWADKTSKFRGTTTSAMAGYVVDDSFRWSGENSHTARIIGGEELVRHIEGLHTAYPGSRIVLLAHSHGGTVALYALGKPKVRRVVSDLLCMNTPFLDCRKRDLKKFKDAAPLAVGGLLFVSCILTLNDRHAGWKLFSMMIAFMATSLAFIGLRRKLDAYQEYLYELLRQQPPLLRTVNITCDDEVGFWLGIVHFLAQVPFRIWNWVTRWGFRLILVCFALSMFGALVSIAIAMAHGNQVDSHSFAGAIDTLLLFLFEFAGAGVPIFAGLTGFFSVAFLVVVALIPRAIHGNRYAFGDGLMQNLLIDIRALKEPPIQDEKTYLAWFYEGVSWGQRHFAYKYPPAIDYICKLLKDLPAWVPPQSAEELVPAAAMEAPRISLRSIWEELKAEHLEKIATAKPVSRRNALAGRVFIFFVFALIAFGFASNIHGCRSSKKTNDALKQEGLPDNVSFRSDNPLPPDALPTIAKDIGGYERYLESAGHPHSWRPVVLEATPTMTSKTKGEHPPSSSWSVSVDNASLTLNASSLPGRTELVEEYGELLLFPANAYSTDGADQTDTGIARAVNLYFCANYAGDSCDVMVDHFSKWPTGLVDFGGAYTAGTALSRALIALRQQAGADTTDKAVMQAFLASEAEQPVKVKTFVGVLLQKIGGDTRAGSALLRARGIPGV